MNEQEMTATILAMVEGWEGVRVKVNGNCSNYTVGEKEKIFGFTRKEGVVLKLPAERVKELVTARGAAALVMGKKTMKEWVVMPYGKRGSAEEGLEVDQRSDRVYASEGVIAAHGRMSRSNEVAVGVNAIHPRWGRRWRGLLLRSIASYTVSWPRWWARWASAPSAIMV